MIPLPLVIQGITAIVSAAPQIEAVAVQAKNFVASMFSSSAISADTQAALIAHIDAVVSAALAGQTPPEFVVDADPS